MVKPRVELQTVFRGSLYKTTLCEYFVYGTCAKGDRCGHAHGEEELTERPNLKGTSLCKNFNNGTCAKGYSCEFAHGLKDLTSTNAFFKTKMCRAAGKCKITHCRYAHSLSELRETTGHNDSTSEGSAPEQIHRRYVVPKSNSQYRTISTEYYRVSSTEPNHACHLNTLVSRDVYQYYDDRVQYPYYVHHMIPLSQHHYPQSMMPGPPHYFAPSMVPPPYYRTAWSRKRRLSDAASTTSSTSASLKANFQETSAFKWLSQETAKKVHKKKTPQ
eukprot:GEMP01055133.1.p1 GENE.GEMP01055133.1~~GEMP01055133.1.p1  ORF type:complete len:273 (+),score=40.72 GEMP01055133.1:174-992(+)